MKKSVRQFVFPVYVFVICAWFVGCSAPPPSSDSQYIIKTTARSISPEEFSEELDLKRAAYPYDIKDQPAEYNEMVIDLVEVLSEEIVLLSAAADKGIIVSDQEVDAAETELKKDYPDDSFEQMLFKNAISYPFWKRRFKKKMIIDRLIDEKLKSKIEISSKDIVAFYRKNQKSSPATSREDSSDKPTDMEERLVSQLRMQKTQDAYKQWIQDIWKDYPIEINEQKLKAFLMEMGTSQESEK